MKLSVIVPVLNEAESIANFLQHLASLLTQNDEVIVVDGGSSDDTMQLAQSHARVIKSSRGRARQMNAGASIASGDVLLFLHVDTRLPDDARSHIENAQNSWGRFDVALSNTDLIYRIIGNMMNWRSRLTSVATGDQAIFVSRSLFKQAGGFANIPLMEDIALSKSLRKHASPFNVSSRAVTSSRRWQQHGVLRTILLMWSLRLRYFLGASPTQLVACYYPDYVESEVLLVFARAPVAGKCNTRLAPLLGDEGAATLQRDLVLYRMHQFARSVNVQLYCAPDDTHALFQHCSSEFGVTLQQQYGDDLGKRMANAIEDTMAQYDKVVLLGTDAPAVDEVTVTRVFGLLDEYDVVVQPAEDGGYVLIAMSRFVPEVFEDIDWGTSSVMQQTAERLQQHGVRWKQLEQAWDIDTEQDYRRYLALMDPGSSPG